MLLQITTKHKKEIIPKLPISNAPMTHNFQHYIEDTYGKGVWQALRYENQRLFSHHINIFGDVVFQLIVDKVSEKLYLPLDFIFQDFSRFMNETKLGMR